MSTTQNTTILGEAGRNANVGGQTNQIRIARRRSMAYADRVPQESPIVVREDRKPKIRSILLVEKRKKPEPSRIPAPVSNPDSQFPMRRVGKQIRFAEKDLIHTIPAMGDETYTLGLEDRYEDRRPEKSGVMDHRAAPKSVNPPNKQIKARIINFMGMGEQENRPTVRGERQREVGGSRRKVVREFGLECPGAPRINRVKALPMQRSKTVRQLFQTEQAFQEIRDDDDDFF